MRVALPWRRRLFLSGAFLLALAALLPMRLALDMLALDARGFSARAVTGSVWLGRLTDARLRGVPLGDMTAELAMFPLLIGEARVGLTGETLRGEMILSGDRAGVSDLSGRLIPVGLPLAAISLDAVDAIFDNGRCLSAAGRLRAEPRPSLPAVVGAFEGALRCDGDAVLAALTSASGRERMDFRLFADGRYRLDLTVRPADPAAAALLATLGFGGNAGGMTLSTAGAL